MAKKKTTKKSVIRKTVKKRTSNKKVVRKRKPKKEIIPPKTLHEKKLLILKRVPIMPCSVISSDKQGIRFAHTQAENVFNRYREECQKEKLVIRLVQLKMSNHTYEEYRGQEWVKVSCSRAECVFEIKDTESGESEIFCGSGLGDNYVWSDNSAQTVAMKQGLLMYFFSAWPQPTTFIEIVKDSLGKLDKGQFAKTIIQMLPEHREDVRKAMSEFFANFSNK